MPTLDWIGKQAVINHHKTIPFHLLKVNPDLSVGENTDNIPERIKHSNELAVCRSRLECANACVMA